MANASQPNPAPEQKTAAPSAKGTAADEADNANASPVPYRVPAPDAIERAVRMCAYAVTLKSREASWTLSAALRIRLSGDQREALAFGALAALDSDEAEATAREVIETAGRPVPPLMGVMDEAASWADFASQAELKSYAVAAYTRLSPADRAAFLEHVQPREVAA